MTRLLIEEEEETLFIIATCDTYNTYVISSRQTQNSKINRPVLWTYKTMFVENITIMYEHDIIILHSKKKYNIY